MDSCFAQTYEAFEIVIGDDSRDNLSELAIQKFETGHPGVIRYFRNIPALGQDRNVNRLLSHARGARLVLLHDDDLLLPNALRDLSDCWSEAPFLTAAFGKQYEINMKGEIINRATSTRHNLYQRMKEKAGLLAVPAEAGLVQMFPNDGFMVATEAARKTGYRSREIVDHACDYDFGLRLCLDAKGIYVLDKFVSCYRFSDDALSNGAMTNPFVYRLLKQTSIPASAGPAYRDAMHFFAPRAVSEYVRQGQGTAALKILLSKDYPRSKKSGPKFLFYFFLAMIAMAAGEKGVAFVFGKRLKWARN